MPAPSTRLAGTVPPQAPTPGTLARSAATAALSLSLFPAPTSNSSVFPHSPSPLSRPTPGVCSPPATLHSPQPPISLHTPAGAFFTSRPPATRFLAWLCIKGGHMSWLGHHRFLVPDLVLRCCSPWRWWRSRRVRRLSFSLFIRSATRCTGRAASSFEPVSSSPPPSPAFAPQRKDKAPAE